MRNILRALRANRSCPRLRFFLRNQTCPVFRGELEDGYFRARSLGGPGADVENSAGPTGRGQENADRPVAACRCSGSSVGSGRDNGHEDTFERQRRRPTSGRGVVFQFQSGSILVESCTAGILEGWNVVEEHGSPVCYVGTQHSIIPTSEPQSYRQDNCRPVLNYSVFLGDRGRRFGLALASRERRGENGWRAGREEGAGSHFCEAPSGPSGQIRPVPFFLHKDLRP